MQKEINELNLVDSLDDVLKNIEVFNKEITQSDELVGKLRNFRHWYYSRTLDMFAPSKFIGYKNNTAADYAIGTSRAYGYMDGRDTEPILNNWSIVAEGLDLEELKDKLLPLFEKYNKGFRKNMCIHILKK
ncbi:hypothetical protein [Clostridium thermarum]|uniref:hypothetical protein n=1 Tax=Clostridium thermarum TaxID=1716543 RepID=UPI001122EC37|nr:hypothetical protein [Clostridium thermarum]